MTHETAKSWDLQAAELKPQPPYSFPAMPASDYTHTLVNAPSTGAPMLPACLTG